MAKQAGINFITGCIDNICFYKMNGQYYARMKSSLDRKRVKTDSRFKQTMRYAGIFGIASKLASQVYGELTVAEKQKGLFRYLTGRAFGFLKEGVFKEDVLFLLRVELGNAASGNRIHSTKVYEDGIDLKECNMHEFTEQKLNGGCLTPCACKYHSAVSLKNVMYTVQQTEVTKCGTLSSPTLCFEDIGHHC